MKLPIFDPLGILKKPAEDALKMVGADVELVDPVREFMLGVIDGIENEEAAVETADVHDEVRPEDLGNDFGIYFAEMFIPNRGAKYLLHLQMSTKEWLSGKLTDDEFNLAIRQTHSRAFRDGVARLPHSDRSELSRRGLKDIDYVETFKEFLRLRDGISSPPVHDEKEAYLEFGKKAITFDCSRCQAIAERVAAAHAPDSPKKQLECMYYIKMFDENELGTDGYDAARDWLEAQGLKDKLYAAYLSELGVES